MPPDDGKAFARVMARELDRTRPVRRRSTRIRTRRPPKCIARSARSSLSRLRGSRRSRPSQSLPMAPPAAGSLPLASTPAATC
jgi:hypothetical protein